MRPFMPVRSPLVFWKDSMGAQDGRLRGTIVVKAQPMTVTF